MQTTAQINIEKKLSPEIMQMIKELAGILKPLLDATHKEKPTSKGYYAEYMAILGKAGANKPTGYIKLLGIAMLYEGCNPEGLNAAVKFLTN
jgi:hypothetical protein